MRHTPSLLCLIPQAYSQGVLQMSTKAPNPVDKYVGSRVRMRRIMLGMSQEKLGEALGLTFQQVQKYEKGTNRVGASRIQQISEILQVPVSFLFEGGPSGTASAEGFAEGSSPAYVSDFLATSEGLALTRAFTRITDAKLRRSIVELVEQIAAREGPDKRLYTLIYIVIPGREPNGSGLLAGPMTGSASEPGISRFRVRHPSRLLPT